MGNVTYFKRTNILGYHQRLARISKKIKEDCSGKPYEQVLAQYDIEAFYDLPTAEDLIYLGDIKNISGTPFFSFNLKDYGYEFSILTKDDLKNIIEQYYQHVNKEFTKLKELLAPLCKNEQIDYDQIVSHLYGKFQIWGNNDLKWRPYNLREDRENIVDSNRYEYDVFELVRILKTFNWKKNHLVLSGW